MEADWEIESGDEAPIIDACWPGLVGLRADPERARELPEARELGGLANTLIRLNSADSLMWTAKCDVWPIADCDRFELDAQDEDAVRALACYIDLLPTSEWRLAETAIEWCESLCTRLRSVPLRCCRADLVLRRAVVAPDRWALGVTAYLIACGSAEAAAAAQLESALNGFADSVLADSPL
jgi:hypothetical protein